MKNGPLSADPEGALAAQINKVRLLSWVIFDAACRHDPAIFQVARDEDKNGILFGLHHILDDLIDAYDAALAREAGGEA